MVNDKKVIFVDIDNTICDSPDDGDYYKCVPRLKYIEKINKLYDDGHRIVYWTARGAKTKINWYEFTKKQLNDWGCRYTKLWTSKPFFDLMIDDKTKRIEEIE